MATHRPAVAGGWTTFPLDCEASGNLDERSRPAVAWLASRDHWFLAFRDANDGSISVQPIPVEGSQRAANPIPVPQVASTTAVAMTALSDGTTLVLAFGTAAGIVTMTSTDGAPFVPAAGAGFAPISSFAPYLSWPGMLAVAGQSRGQIDIVVSSSTDGVVWTPFATTGSLGNFGAYIPAAAGIVGGSTMVIAYTGSGNEIRSTIVVFSDNRPRVVVPLNASAGVAVAFGPTPALAAAP